MLVGVRANAYLVKQPLLLCGAPHSDSRREKMGDLSHYFDIILFAMVAAFLVLLMVLARDTVSRPTVIATPAE